MYIIIGYDVNTTTKAGVARLAKVAKHCQNYGQRVQNSLFECSMDYNTFLQFKKKLIELIDQDKDSLRIYYLGNKWEKKVEHIGQKESYNPQGTLII